MTFEPRRILLLQPRFLGDVLLCTPAIRAVRTRFPNAGIDFVTEKGGAEVLRRNPHLDRVLVRGAGFGGRLRLLRDVASGGYDAAVDFRATGSTAHLVAATRAPLRIGIRTNGPTNFAYTHLFPLITLDRYAARYKLDMLAPLGVESETGADLRLELPVGAEAEARVAAWWQAEGLHGERVVAMSPVSRERFKDWGADRWVRVGRWLLSSGYRVLVTHGPGEAAAASTVAAALGERAHLFGGGSLEEFAAVLSRCLLWTGNDGGARHVAVASGTPTLAVSRWRIGPVWTHPEGPVAHRSIDQAPRERCDMRCPSCPHRGCLAELQPEQVLDRLSAALAEVNGGSPVAPAPAA